MLFYRKTVIAQSMHTSHICCTAPIVSPVCPFIFLVLMVLADHKTTKHKARTTTLLIPTSKIVVIKPIRNAIVVDTSSGRPVLAESPISLAQGVAHMLKVIKLRDNAQLVTIATKKRY